MLGVLGLALVQAALVSVRGGGPDGCPSEAQIAEAISVRMPGSVVSAVAPGDGVARVDVSPAPTGLRVIVSDDAGQTLLMRLLEVSATKTRDCTALAQTVALIVERYFDELALPALAPPPPPTPPPLPPAPVEPTRAPRWELALEGRAKAPDEGLSGLSAVVQVGRVFGGTSWSTWLRAGGGVGGALTLDPPQGPDVRLRRYPFEVEAGIRRWLGGLWADGGATLGADVVRIDDTVEIQWRAAPLLGARLRLGWDAAPWLFVSASIGIDVSFVRLRIESRTTSGMLYEGSRVRGGAALSVGLRF